jgi:hypothetical protein
LKKANAELDVDKVMLRRLFLFVKVGAYMVWQASFRCFFTVFVPVKLIFLIFRTVLCMTGHPPPRSKFYLLFFFMKFFNKTKSVLKY